MSDLALSTVASPLAALLSGGAGDSPATKTAATQGPDPFAALLASATVIPKADAPAGTKAADAVAALLSDAAPAAATPVAPSPIMVAAKPPTATAPSVAAEPLAAESDAAPVASSAKTKAKTEEDDSDADSAKKDDGGDPLADAIASGATAVLAFIPIIAAPVQPRAQDAAPVEVALKIDAPVAPKPLKLTSASIGPAPARQSATNAQPEVQGQVQAQVQARADQAAATQDRMDSDAAQADARTPQPQQPQQEVTADARPATAQLAPEVTKAVVAALNQADANPTTVAPPTATNESTAVETTKPRLQPQPSPQQAAQQMQHQVAPVPSAPQRRRGEEIAAPRRAGDTRKRADILPADAASAGLPPRASDAGQPTISRPVTDVQAKGDTIVEQTLTVARDGAWLDKLAHDIASAGSGNDLHFKLEPQNLGALSVAIRQSDDGASIRLTADNQTTHDILVDAQPKLIAEARAQGLKVSEAHVDIRQDQNQSQNQSNNQDAQRWAHNQAGQNGTSQNGQNRQSSPGHQPFVSNLARKAEADSESPDRDSDARYA